MRNVTNRHDSRFDPSTMMQIVVINRSPQITAREAELMTRACARQREHDVRHTWYGSPGAVRLADRKEKLPRHALAIVLLEESDDEQEREEGYLGYHTEDDNGVRWGRVYTKPILAARHGSVLGLGD